jgi:hypothetical protein
MNRIIVWPFDVNILKLLSFFVEPYALGYIAFDKALWTSPWYLFSSNHTLRYLNVGWVRAIDTLF